MELFEKIGGKISSTGKDVAKKAKDATEIAKLNSRVRSLEDTVREIQLNIGKMYFETNKNDPAPEFVEMFQQITNAQDEIVRCKDEICTIKGVRTCINCGTEIPNNSLFCPACGTKNEIANAQNAPEAAAQNVFCPNCGTSLPNGTSFCPNCGTKLN